MKLFLVLHLHSHFIHFCFAWNWGLTYIKSFKNCRKDTFSDVWLSFSSGGAHNECEGMPFEFTSACDVQGPSLGYKTLTEHEDCHDCTGRDLGRLCFCRGLPSLCFSCRGCVFSMPSGFLTVHKGLFIHRQRMPAGVSTNQIMTLSAPAHWPAATTHMTPRGPRAMFCGKKCWIMKRTKKVLWLRRTVRQKGWECYNEANQL